VDGVQCAGLSARADGGADGGDDEDICVGHGNSFCFGGGGTIIWTR